MLDGERQRLDHILHMHEGRSMRDVAGKHVADEALFVNALDLMRDWDRMAAIVIHTGDAQKHHRHVAPLTQEQLLRRDLRLGIIPFWFERPILVDTLSRFARRMHKHGAGKYELLDLKVAQSMQQPFGAAHGHLLIQGTWRT